MAIRPPISYPGGKWKALPQILELVPDDIEDWREPFFGGGSVTLGFIQSEKSSKCKKFIVGDLAKEQWAFWKGLQQNAKKVHDIAESWWIEKCPTQIRLQGLDENSDEYKSFEGQCEVEGRAFWAWSQSIDCDTLSLEERAARIFLVNRISFSGMGDSGSMSRDQLKGFRMHHLDKLDEVGPLLQHLEILNESFEVTMANTDDEKSFIFLDPPYCNQEKSGLYGRNGDTHKGFPHKEFARLCKQTKCKWLITYDDSIKVRKMFKGKGIYVKPFHIQYTMAGKTAEDALAGEELFIANYDIMEHESFDMLNSII